MEIEFRTADGCNMIVDFGAKEIGPEKDCRRITVNGKRYLEVSRPIDYKIPEQLKGKISLLRNSCVVSDELPPRPDGTRVCYTALYDEQGPFMVNDLGMTFPGDKGEFAHYILWNPKTGELSLSEELSL
ncbi:MAG: hypothetical protein Q4G65_16740 [bacterium]|nr:hypothetical protein [bacterium]